MLDFELVVLWDVVVVVVAREVVVVVEVDETAGVEDPVSSGAGGRITLSVVVAPHWSSVVPFGQQPTLVQ